ncbi:MAG TPA: outer membrane beta-barrel protein, partial [Chitinophagaceae bacterium]|nr:outer membrane beta-barrel protein [Chitinophagaceae bacterium]
MKRTLITIAAVSALCSAANAQGRKGLWISPSASLGVGTMADAYVPAPGFDTKFSVNFAIGAEASYMFTDNIGAGTGINFAGYGYLFRAEDGGNKMDYIGSQAFLEIPVFFRFVAGRGGNGFFTNVGFINGF